MFEHETHELLKQIIEEQCRTNCLLSEILKELKPAQVWAAQIKQIIGGKAMSVTGTNAGGQSVFEVDAILNGLADPAGFPAGSVDTWAVDDSTVTLTPNNNQVTASVPATDTAASYNLSVSVQMPGTPPPAPLTATVNVPIIQAPPPVPTGAVISQVS